MSVLLDEIQEIAGLRPGGIYLLRARHPLPLELMKRAQERLNGAAEKIGCQFFLLDESFELVKPVEVDSVLLEKRV